MHMLPADLPRLVFIANDFADMRPGTPAVLIASGGGRPYGLQRDATGISAARSRHQCALFRTVAVVATFLLWAMLPLTVAAEIPLLPFCLGKAPDDGALKDYYAAQCPGVLALAEQQGNESVEAAADKARVDLEKAQLDNLKATLPASAPPTAAAAVDIKGFKHFAEFRQIALLDEASQSISTDLKGYYDGTDAKKPAISAKLRMISPNDLAVMRSNTLPVQILNQELARFQAKVLGVSAACALERPKKTPKKPANLNYAISMSNAPLLTADALLGFSLKVSQAFQTSLGATEAATLGDGANAVVRAALASRLSSGNFSLFLGMPAISGNNVVIKQLDSLRAASEALLAEMAGAEEKSKCLVNGKALLESIHARLEELNKVEGTNPSPMLTAMRVAEFSVASKAGSLLSDTNFLIVDVLHSGGSVATTKTPYTSQRVSAIAAVSVAYRVEDIDGKILTSALFHCPGGAQQLDVVRYKKDFSMDASKHTAATCSELAAQ